MISKFLASATLLASVTAAADKPECVSLERFASTLREVELRDVDLYRGSGEKRAGRILELNLAAQPAVVRLDGASADELFSHCVRREDVERRITYRPEVIAHDMDGVACVTFDEGRPHSRLFQRMEHNRGVELRLYPFTRSAGRWIRLSARAGFTEEAFGFDCGVQVGDPALLKLTADGVFEDARAVVRADSPLATEPGFEKTAEFEWRGVRYFVGRGVAPVE